ncbi:YgjP-like metallopeptidase domain-containing protein [Rhizobium leguminosarum]
MAEPHHGPTFYDLLSRVMPDWSNRKQRLERVMA